MNCRVCNEPIDGHEMMDLIDHVGEAGFEVEPTMDSARAFGREQKFLKAVSQQPTGFELKFVGEEMKAFDDPVTAIYSYFLTSVYHGVELEPEPEEKPGFMSGIFTKKEDEEDGEEPGESLSESQG